MDNFKTNTNFQTLTELNAYLKTEYQVDETCSIENVLTSDDWFFIDIKDEFGVEMRVMIEDMVYIYIGDVLQEEAFEHNISLTMKEFEEARGNITTIIIDEEI